MILYLNFLKSQNQPHLLKLQIFKSSSTKEEFLWLTPLAIQEKQNLILNSNQSIEASMRIIIKHKL